MPSCPRFLRVSALLQSWRTLALALVYSGACVSSAKSQPCDPTWLVDTCPPAVSANVYALVEWNPGGGRPTLLVAGGEFFSSTGLAHLAAWNGANWFPLDVGINGPVMSLVVDSTGGLIVGGHFTTVGSISANNIARWDGTSWTTLGSAPNDGVTVASNLLFAAHFRTACGHLRCLP